MVSPSILVRTSSVLTITHKSTVPCTLNKEVATRTKPHRFKKKVTTPCPVAANVASCSSPFMLFVCCCLTFPNH